MALRWRSRARAVADLSAEICAHPALRTLVSSEHFSTHFDRSEALSLASDFARFEPEIIVVLRDPHARLLSSYNTHVTAGGALSLETFARSMLVPETRFMSARVMLTIWDAAFGAERIHVLDYDREPDIVGAVLRETGTTMLPADPRPFRDRRSLDPGALETLRQANVEIRRRLARSPESDFAAALQLAAASATARRGIMRARQSGSSPDCVARWRLSAESAAALDTIVLDDRRYLADRFALTLRGSTARERIEIGEPIDGGNETAPPLPGLPLLLWSGEVAARLCRRFREGR